MKSLALFALLFPSTAISCAGYVVGFKGINDNFDNAAFIDYSRKTNYCYKAYSWNQTKQATKFINNLTVPYHLYGYSMGAGSIKEVLNTVTKRPEFVITIGAYKNTDVNFTEYNIKFENYFDDSGVGQTSPGKFVFVPHNKIQQAVNKLVFKQSD